MHSLLSRKGGSKRVEVNEQSKKESERASGQGFDSGLTTTALFDLEELNARARITL